MPYLDNDISIAGKKTVLDWLTDRVDLSTNLGDNVKWESAYNEYFIGRLQSRYLDPIDEMAKSNLQAGEGFAIMTVICSVIEFLESIYQGRNYQHSSTINRLTQYNKSGQLFKDFLTQHQPFASVFTTRRQAKSFYENVRCGLLHEARTKGNWTINVDPTHTKGPVVLQAGGGIVYRDNFRAAIQQYVDTTYRAELLASDERKNAFMRKFDYYCRQ